MSTEPIVDMEQCFASEESRWKEMSGDPATPVVEQAVEAALTQPPMQASSDLMQMFAQLLAAQNESNREMFLSGIAEMRKPTEAEQKKQDEEKARSMQLTMNRIAAARKEEEGKAGRIAGCSHTKPNGKTNLRGQVHSNGSAKAYCSYCGYNSGWFVAYPHELNGGLNMADWGTNAFAIVQSRVRNSPQIPPPVPDVPFGATISF